MINLCISFKMHFGILHMINLYTFVLHVLNDLIFLFDSVMRDIFRWKPFPEKTWPPECR